jgi:signal transduction histidine kinase
VKLRSLWALTLAFLFAFLTATLVTGYATYSATKATIAELVDKRIAGAASVLRDLGPRHGPAAVIERIEDFTGERDTGDLGVLLTDAGGRRLAGNLALDRPLPLGYSTLTHLNGIKGLSAGRALVQNLGDGTRLTIVAETEPFDDYHTARIRIYLLGFGSIIVVVVGGVACFGWVVGRRIVAMRRTVDAIIDGDMQRRIPVDGSGSVFDQQAQAFNRMLDRIAELMVGISNVSNDISHDLRTPLARLHNRLVAIARRTDAAGLRDEIDTAIAQSDDLMAMFTAIMRIVEIEGGDRRAGFEALDAGALAREIGTMMEPLAEEAGHVLLVGLCTLSPIHGDCKLLTQALINLIDNALVHSPGGSRIAIAAVASRRAVTISIADNGPGIPAEQRALAMRRFGRLDKSRHGSGHGLGLPLVEAIVRLHRGTIALEDAAPGLRVVVTLPLT